MLPRPLTPVLSPRVIKVAAVASAVSAAGLVAAHATRHQQHLVLTPTCIEAVAGAAGEVAQIALVYPIDTIKVRCQAAGLSSRQVVAQLWAASRGSWPAFLAACYAGAVPAAALSVLVGATHYVCYCASRRALAKAVSGESNSSQPQQKQQQQHPQQPDSSSLTAGDGSMQVNCASAVLTAAVTAVVESPLELFRHNSQAGTIQGNFIVSMVQTLHKSGPLALYQGFIPYCLESLPYDISELLVVGAAKDWRQHPAARALPPVATDLAVGGLAGAVAVLVSMPVDTIKTYTQTHGAIGATAGSSAAAAAASSSRGLAHSLHAFWRTGQALVARGGPSALYVGLAPRLAHQVPGAMVCWLTIESTHRLLTETCGAGCSQPGVLQQPAASGA